jgi:hypothetical protein
MVQQKDAFAEFASINVSSSLNLGNVTIPISAGMMNLLPHKLCNSTCGIVTAGAVHCENV